MTAFTITIVHACTIAILHACTIAKVHACTVDILHASTIAIRIIQERFKDYLVFYWVIIPGEDIIPEEQQKINLWFSRPFLHCPKDGLIWEVKSPDICSLPHSTCFVLQRMSSMARRKCAISYRTWAWLRPARFVKKHNPWALVHSTCSLTSEHAAREASWHSICMYIYMYIWMLVCKIT